MQKLQNPQTIHSLKLAGYSVQFNKCQQGHLMLVHSKQIKPVDIQNKLRREHAKFILNASSQTEQKSKQATVSEDQIQSQPKAQKRDIRDSRQLLYDLQREKGTQSNIPSIFNYQGSDEDQYLNYDHEDQPQLQKQQQTQSKYSREMAVKEKDPQLEQKQMVFQTQAKPKTISFNIGDFSTAHLKPERQEVVESQMTQEEQQEEKFEQIHLNQEQDMQRRKAASELQEGVNILQDGTIITTRSGVELGQNGFQSKWTVVSGQTADKETLWEEKWWENSDWSGLKELGCEQTGCNAYGDAWRNYWTEKLANDSQKGGQPVIIRNAEKRAKNLAGNEWEEKWYEQYEKDGKVSKSADKWTREYDSYNQQDNIWHEKWGEDYDKDWCRKWTDRWSERGNLGINMHKWGDKWEEDFYHGKGHKYGETWDTEGGPGQTYHRKWGENHYGEGWVRKWGESNTGEQWDTTDQSGTYYNPIPHFGFDHAYDHSLELHKIQPRPGGPPPAKKQTPPTQNVN